MRWRGDIIVNAVMTLLITAGGLGFFVLVEILSRRTHRLQWSLHTKIVIAASFVLSVGGTVAFLILESSNPRTLGPLPAGERVLAAWFQSVTSRTAGFNTIDIGAMTEAGLFITMALMFIGASPGSHGSSRA